MIELQQINKLFYEGRSNAFHALKDINLDIDAKITLLHGVSGSGKSTLLSLIAGMSRPTSGAIVVDGENIAKYSEYYLARYRSEKIGIVFQHFNLMDGMSVKENIELALVPHRLPKKIVEQKIEKALKAANIEHKKDEDVRVLSGGEKQRCAIARAIVNEPKYLLFDEPTAALDSANKELFIELLVELEKVSAHIIIATHDPIFSRDKLACERIIVEDAKAWRE